MIIDCIGCLHGARPNLEGGDLLIVTGDLTAHDNEIEYLRFFEWLTQQEYKKIIFIGGNHDNWLKNNRNTYDKGKIEYLYDSGAAFCYYEPLEKNESKSIKRKDFKIWGSPWTASFKGINPKCTAFTEPYGNDTDDRLNDHWKKIPRDIDILITHGPPYGILDTTNRGEHVGSGTLLARVLDIKPKLHVFSHIHECGGQEFILKREGYGDENNTRFVNCSIMSDNYSPDNEPIRVYL